MSNIYAFDVETFPNLFTMIAVNVDEDFDENIFVIGFGRDDSEQIKEFVKGKTLVGYNNLYFDNMILNAVIAGKKPEELYELAGKAMTDDPGPEVWNLRNKSTNYKSIDLMAIYAFDKLGVSLKNVSILLKWHKVQESDLPFDQEVKLEDLQKVLQYNSNDVQITKQLYKNSLKIIKTRQDITKLYNIDLINASDSRMGNLLFEKMYSQHTGLLPERFKLLRTDREVVEVRDCISKDIYFRSEILQNLLHDLENLTLRKSITKEIDENTWRVNNTKDFAFSKSVKFANKTFDMGVGGLHSQDDPGKFESDGEYWILDADVSSFYPNIMLVNKIKPAHLGEQFTLILSLLTKERMAAKKAKDDTKAEAMKITVNAIFGKLGFESYWLYDPQAFYSVTINGQLYLLMLVEHLTLKGIEVISANTDGVTCKVRKDQLEDYQKVCLRWQELTTFELEIAVYRKYIRRDVNNYIALKGGKFTPEKLMTLDESILFKEFSAEDIKKKGIFEDEIIKEESIKAKGYKPPIIAKALNDYFLTKQPIEETINSSSDIYDFFMFQKCSKKFKLFYQNGGEPQSIQRMSRFYACLEGGEIYKLCNDEKTGKPRKLSLRAGVSVKVLNDVLANISFDQLKVDKNYYIQQTREIVDKIEYQNIQLSLW